MGIENGCDSFDGWNCRFGPLLPVFGRSVNGGGKNLFAVSPRFIQSTLQAVEAGKPVKVSSDVVQLFYKADAIKPKNIVS